MIFTLLYILAGIVYLMPGLVLARGVYSEQVRQITSGTSRPKVTIPPKPARPEIDLEEMLHQTDTGFGRKCNYIDPNKRDVCSCKYRKDWVKLKNQWLDYEEWEDQYGSLAKRYGIGPAARVDMVPVYGAIVAWPLVGALRFVKGGAKNIPDYREIERLEKEIES